MRSLRSRSLRLALVAALVVVVAGIAATIAMATAFDDAKPCPVTLDNGQPLLVCPGGTVGTPYSITLEARGCPPFKYSVLSGALPAGLSLTSSGVLSGTPTASGTSRFYVQLYENCAYVKTAEREFKISIDPGIQIVTNDIPKSASVGQPYTAQLDAQVVTNLNPLTGSPATGATWSVAPDFGTGLPPGLSLGNGVISGSPTTEGSYSFRIQASLNGASHFQTYALNVRQPLKVVAARPLATAPLPTAWEVGLPFSAKLTPSGGSGTYTIALGSGALPTGLTLGPDGTISGTPSAAGVFHATVRFADSEGRTVDYAASFGVAARLTVGTVALRPGKVGRLYRAKLATTGGVPAKKWKVLAGPLPKGLRFSSTLGTLSGTPTKAGKYRVTFQVTDGLKVVSKKTLRIVVVG